MKLRHALCLGLPALALAMAFISTATVWGGEYLVADRLTNRVLRYSEGGSFLGVLIDDQVNLNEPAGLTISPNGSKLYVTSRLNSAVVEYNYSGTTATYSKSITSANAAPSTIDAPASVLFSPDGSTMYVSNLGQQAMANTVARLNADGTSAGNDLVGGDITGRSGLAWSPSGELLVSDYGFFGPPFPFGEFGGVLRYDTASQTFVEFVDHSQDLRGAANMLVVGDDLYLVAGYGGRLGRFDANTGALDTTFATNGYVAGLDFPATVALGPGGQSLLVSVLTSVNGAGFISEYDFDGNLLGNFAMNSNANPALGFREATAIAYSTVPEPTAAMLGLVGLAVTGLLCGSRRNREFSLQQA